MTDTFIGEIRMFGGNFAPDGWATCDGQLLSIADNSTLFNLIGTTYGGDGQSTFALPNLAARIPIHQGRAQSGTSYTLAQVGGQTDVTLVTGQLPSHHHAFMASTDTPDQAAPAGHGLAAGLGRSTYYKFAGSNVMSSSSIGPAGSGQSHPNMMPYLALTFIIALYGVYPSQS